MTLKLESTVYFMAVEYDFAVRIQRSVLTIESKTTDDAETSDNVVNNESTEADSTNGGGGKPG